MAQGHLGANCGALHGGRAQGCYGGVPTKVCPLILHILLRPKISGHALVGAFVGRFAKLVVTQLVVTPQISGHARAPISGHAPN